MQIRRALASDVAELTRLAHAAKRSWGYPDDWMELWRADLTLTPEQIQSQAVYCAVAGSRIVAFYAVSADEQDFELEHMWVDPEHMRAGLGTRLFRHAVDLVRSLGGTSLRIASDPNAEPFYLRQGARRVGLVPSQPAGRELPLLAVDVVREHGDRR